MESHVLMKEAEELMTDITARAQTRATDRAGFQVIEGERKAAAAGASFPAGDMAGAAVLSEPGSLTEVVRPLYYRVVKRCMDIVCSVAALVVLSPVFLVTAAAIRLEDGGPVFYVQERNGQNGKVFRMYKFRSMCRNAEEIHKELLEKNELDGPAFKLKDDPRVTKVGRFIRRTSIDELPQLVNIIKGEMSIVGPRPLPTYETEQCSAYQKQRMGAKPGLTCYWQICGRSDVPFDEWIEMDLKYIREAGVWVDLRMIGKTVFSVMRGRGAY